MVNYKTIDVIKIAYAMDYSIPSVSEALDLLSEVFSNGCERVIISKEMLTGDFFSLRTGLAGEILQKFSNYNIRLAIVGDFSIITSKSLSAFIYESNRGRQVFFKETLEEAVSALKGV